MLKVFKTTLAYFATVVSSVCKMFDIGYRSITSWRRFVFKLFIDFYRLYMSVNCTPKANCYAYFYNAFILI